MIQLSGPYSDMAVDFSLYLSKISKCLSGWELYCLSEFSSDAHFSYDTPWHSVFHVPFSSVAQTGSATNSLIVNSKNVILDDIWAWRADHGNGVGWNSNTADTGVVVNSDNVTAYGLFVEHYQKYEVIWNGYNGTDIFFQNEMPYDPVWSRISNALKRLGFRSHNFPRTAAFWAAIQHYRTTSRLCEKRRLGRFSASSTSWMRYS